MPINTHLVRKNTRDTGTAQMMADVHRRLRNVEGQYGKIGNGATITSPTITTADMGERVVLQGVPQPDGSGGFLPQNIVNGGAGVFCTDSSGNVAVSIKPGVGITLASGALEVNSITWNTGVYSTGNMYSESITSGGGSISIASEASTGSTYNTSLLMQSDPSSSLGGALARIRVYDPAGTTFITLCNSGRLAIFPKSVGQFGVSGPSSQPGTPVTLPDVIALLQSYGMCS